MRRIEQELFKLEGEENGLSTPQSLCNALFNIDKRTDYGLLSLSGGFRQEVLFTPFILFMWHSCAIIECSSSTMSTEDELSCQTTKTHIKGLPTILSNCYGFDFLDLTYPVNL